MIPKVIIDDSPEMKTSWNIMFGDTTNSRKSDKKETRGIVVYEWLLSMIDHLCETCFLGTHTCTQFHTNIDSIKFQLYEARNKPIAVKKESSKPKVVPAPKIAAVPKCVPTFKVIPAPKPAISNVVVKNKPFLRGADNSNTFDAYYEDWNDYDEDA